MTYEEIDNLKFDAFKAFEMLVDIHVISSGQKAYSWPSEYKGPMDWDNCAVHPELLSQVEGNKPSEEYLLAVPWENYLAQLRRDEDLRLAEIARIAAIEVRWYAMTDIRANLNKAGIEIANPEMLLIEIIQNNDIDKLELLESKAPEVLSERQDVNDLNQQMEKIDLGFEVIALMGAINNRKSLTGEQVVGILTALSAPKAILESGSVATAIGYIAQMTLPDMITEQDRVKILDYATAGLAKIVAKYS